MNPSLALIPSAFNTGKLYSVLPEDGTGDFTVSRNGNATFFDKDGILRTALPNQPRFDFDPVTGQFRGVLVEPNAINLAVSNTVSPLPAIPYNRNILTVQSSTDSVVEGFKSTKIIANNGSTFSNILNEQILEAGIRYSASVFVKKDGLLPLFRLIIGTQAELIYNLDNKLVSILGNTSQRNITFQFVELKNGWFFCSGTYTATSGVLNRLQFSFGSQVGDGTSGFLIQFPHFQLGEITSTILNPTTSQVTRPADQITVTVPMGATQCVYILNGTQVTVPVTGGQTFTLPNGRITQLYMI